MPSLESIVRRDRDNLIGDVARLTADIERMRTQIMELKRTRSEAEANARVAGYREGIDEIVKRLRALGVTVNIPH